MKREILFRAKSKETNSWLYGDLCSGLNDEMYIRHIVESGQFSKEAKITMIEKRTVGQFTGLKDKNGVKIFEDDIVRDGCRLLVVKFNNGSFNFWTKHKTKLIQVDTTWLEVIGNIIENPNMLND